MKPITITVERPDTECVVDFLDKSTVVTVGLTDDGRVRVVVKVSHGDGASTWDQHEWESP
jgi:hypothetical protein